MKFEVNFFQPFKNYFKLHVIFRSFHKYLVDRFEHKHVAILQTTIFKGYNNRKNKSYPFPPSHIMTIVQFDYISITFGHLKFISGLSCHTN